MKHVKLYNELKFNEKKYHPYDLLNLVKQNFLSIKDEKNIIEMIKSGQIDLDLQDQLNNRTALMITMLNRYERAFDALIESGANLDIISDNGTSALIWAAIGSRGYNDNNYYFSIIEKLIDAGADWNITQSYSIKNGIKKDFLDYITDSEFKKHILKKYHKQYEIYLMKKNANKFNI